VADPPPDPADPHPAGPHPGGLVDLAAVRAAADRIAGAVLRTPLLAAAAPMSTPDRPLWIKPESLQPTGAFKLRGATNAVRMLSAEQAARGVVAHSSGNHAQALAYAARAAGIAATLVIPDPAPAAKVAATEALGARVLRVPPARRAARVAELVAAEGLTEIPPYDDARVIAGQGTVGLEIVADLPDVDVVLVPISGGGLISGVAAAVTALRPGATVIGVQPELSGHAAQSLREGRRVAWDPGRTFRTAADALRVTQLGTLPWQHIRRLVGGIVTVTEAEIAGAVRSLAFAARLVAEPGGAVTTAAALYHGGQLPAGRTVAVLSGGNVDPRAWLDLLATGAAVTRPGG
jgi:threonine dehydratase